MEKVKVCVFQVNYHFIWVVKYCRKVLVGSVGVGLLVVLEMFVDNYGCRLLVCRVYVSSCVYVFVFVKLSVFVVGVLVCVLVRLLFLLFLWFRLWFWGGCLWFEGYAVCIAGGVTSVKIEDCVNRV